MAWLHYVAIREKQETTERKITTTPRIKAEPSASTKTTAETAIRTRAETMKL